MSSASGLDGCSLEEGELDGGDMVGNCDIAHSSICQFCFGRLAIITLISRWVHAPCIHDDRESVRGIWGYLTRPTSQVVARGELIPLRI